MLTGDKDNGARCGSGVHTEKVRPRGPIEGNVPQGEHRHVCVQLLSQDCVAFPFTGYVILTVPRNVTDGDIGALLHQLILRENK